MKCVKSLEIIQFETYKGGQYRIYNQVYVVMVKRRNTAGTENIKKNQRI